MDEKKKKFLNELHKEEIKLINEYNKEQIEYDINTKFETIIIGEKSVGKTSIISTFHNDSFNPDIEPTKGNNYDQLSYYIEQYDKYFGYSIWDTSGDKMYRSLVKLYLKKAQVFILVYDITKKETFNELKEYWITEIKKYLTSKSGKLLYFYNFLFL